MSHPMRFRSAMVALAALASAAPAPHGAESGDPRAPGSADVAASPVSTAPPVGGDLYLPTGPLYFSPIGRPDGDLPACSFRHAVCVHARHGLPKAVVLATLTELERASALLVDTLGLPAPLADGRAGGSPAFDLYLVPPGSADL